jgi:hypothetical protein
MRDQPQTHSGTQADDMPRWTTVVGLLAMLLFALLAAGCSDAVSPERHGDHGPAFAVAPGAGITLDRSNASMGTGTPFQGGTHIGDGFVPTNPHRGDAIVATFFWRGSSNVITTVTDHLADGTPVGNTYTLVEYVTDGTMSMATYVATNVQNFPDPNIDDNGTLDVHAITSSPVTDDGIILSAYSDVAGTSAEAFGAHRSAAGLGSSPTAAAPGAIPVDAGALAYGVSLASAAVGVDAPVGFTNITAISSATAAADEIRGASRGGLVNGQWTYSGSPAAGSRGVTLKTSATQLAFLVSRRRPCPSRR